MVGLFFVRRFTLKSCALLLARRRLFSGRQQGFLGFLQMIDGFIDLVDRGLELAACQLIIAVELGFELVQVFLEVRNINILVFDFRQLYLVGGGVHGSIAQHGDHGDEELRTDDVHFRVLV